MLNLKVFMLFFHLLSFAPRLVFCDGFDDYEDGADKFHEAGYDAYCTGVCFAKMALHLCKFV